jgi:hypothetical protein
MAHSRYYPGPQKDEGTVRDILRRQQLIAPAPHDDFDRAPIAVEEVASSEDVLTLTRTDEHAIFQLVFGTETAHAGHLSS